MLPVSTASWIIQQYEQLFPANNETMMYIRVEADWSPTWWTNYRIITYSHDLVPQALLLALAAVLLAVGIALVSWAFSSAVKTVGAALPKIGWGVLMGAAGVALVLFAMVSYNKSKVSVPVGAAAIDKGRITSTG